jgi:hypothetical protein
MNTFKPIFKLIETHQVLDPQYINKVLNNQYLAYVVRGYFTPQYAHEVVTRFDQHPLRQEVKVGKHLVKESLKLKGPLWSSKQYEYKFSVAAEDQKVHDSIFDPDNNPHYKIASQFDAYMNQHHNIHFRPLRRNNINSTFGVMQRWTGSEEGFIARPHTDYLFFRKFKALEIGHLTKSGSCVTCWQNGDAGAFTRIYNYIPTKAENKEAEYYEENPSALKKRKTKPTFLAKLEQAEYVDVLLNPGDILFFSVKFFHDVRVANGKYPRVTSYIFYGQLPEGDIVYWY